MSARFIAAHGDLAALGDFLEALNAATSACGPKISNSFTIEISDGNTIDASWDAEHEQYVIDDLVGG